MLGGGGEKKGERGTGRKRRRKGRGRAKGRGEGSETYVAHSLASMDLMMYSPVPKVCVQRVKLKEENQCNM